MKMKLKLRKSFRRHIRKTRSSLVAQQLGFDAFNCGDPALIPGQGTNIYAMQCGQNTKKKKKKKERKKRQKERKQGRKEKITWRPV